MERALPDRLLGGIGLLFAAFGRWNFLGWRGREQATLSFRTPGDVALTPAQRACAWFFLVMAALFLIQTMVGAASQHYRADLASFFGVDLAQWFPYNLMRTWHVQLAIFWVATSFLAAGIFLAPDDRWTRAAGTELARPRAARSSGRRRLREPDRGVRSASSAITGDLWAWFGNQGFEYLDLGRFWQILLSVGLFFWVVMLFRGLRERLRREHVGNMPWLFFFAALAIPAFYAVGLLARPESHFTTADFWRFWVVHLWVEDFLELFTTVMVAYIFVLLGVVREKVALTVIFLDILLYSAGGVIGTMHHLYFSGTPAEHMALGAFFSAAEVIPLTFLTVEAWSFLQLGARQESRSRTPFPHRWAVMFLVAVGFWNFLGAGIFGFLINLPIISYYEIGTALTANHGHAAMMGVYGMLAAGLALFCLRYLIPEERWSERAAKISFWSLNIGLAWMCFATLFPLGILQLYESVSSRLLRGPHARVHHQRYQRPLRVGASAGRRGLYRRRRPAAAVHLLPRRALHRPADNDGGAGGHPVHRDHRTRNHRAEGAVAVVIHPEVLLMAGYAVFLLAVSFGLDLLARHSHARSERYRTAGFTYHHSPTPGSAPRTRSCSAARSTTTGGWFATGEGPRSATTAPRRPTARTPTKDARWYGPWIPGPTPRRAVSTAASRSRWPL